MDEDNGLSFGYQTPEDVTKALRSRFRRLNEAGMAGQGAQGALYEGPFVYHAEGLTFAYVEHESEGAGERRKLIAADGCNGAHIAPR